MIEWSLDVLRACESVAAIIVAAPPGGVEQSDVLGGDDLTVVTGGATRARSVANALAVVKTELVAIHDAARPLLTSDLVEELVAALDAAPEAAGVIAAAAVTDTIKQVGETRSAFPAEEAGNALLVQRTLDRSRLWAAQTPQVFRAEALRGALKVGAELRDAATDEAMLVEVAGGTVLIHPSSAENLKVTTPLDLEIAELLLARRASGGT